jgi:hypothetical protein
MRPKGRVYQLFQDLKVTESIRLHHHPDAQARRRAFIFALTAEAFSPPLHRKKC